MRIFCHFGLAQKDTIDELTGEFLKQRDIS